METLAVVTGLVGLIVLILIINPVIIYFCWNWLMPMLFALPEVTFWQAVGISLLSSALFKGGFSSSKSK